MKFKIAFFDCDGVLSFGNTWVEVHKIAGITKKQNSVWRSQFYSGEITWDQWFERFESTYRENGVTEKDFYSALSKIVINEEARELFRRLKKYSLKTAIVFGSIDIHVKRVAEELGVDIWKANTSVIYNSEGLFKKFKNISDEVHAKEIFVKKICNKFKVSPIESLFVGDSANDTAAFKLTKHGILYNHYGYPEDMELKKYAWREIDNLLEILEILDE